MSWSPFRPGRNQANVSSSWYAGSMRRFARVAKPSSNVRWTSSGFSAAWSPVWKYPGLPKNTSSCVYDAFTVFDFRVRDHRVQGADHRPIGVLFLFGTRPRVVGLNQLIGLRRRLAQPADGPRIVGVDLVVHAHHPVPDVVVREVGEIELRPGVDVHRPAAILLDAL